MVVRNRYLVGVAAWFLRKKVKRFSFAYEIEVYETDIVNQTYVRRYIAELQEAVQTEIQHLTKEYNL